MTPQNGMAASVLAATDDYDPLLIDLRIGTEL
jgi:hypothetical protein